MIPIPSIIIDSSSSPDGDATLPPLTVRYGQSPVYASSDALVSETGPGAVLWGWCLCQQVKRSYLNRTPTKLLRDRIPIPSIIIDSASAMPPSLISPQALLAFGSLGGCAYALTRRPPKKASPAAAASAASLHRHEPSRVLSCVRENDLSLLTLPSLALPLLDR